MTTTGTMQGNAALDIRSDYFPESIVERAGPADVPEILALGKDMHRESVYSFLPFDEDKGRKLLESAVKNSDGMFLGVVRGTEEIVGFFLGYITPYFFCNELMAHDLLMYVKPEYRGTSAASELAGAFTRWGFARGAREVAIGVSALQDNTRTYSFLRKLGFSEAGREFKVRRV